MEKELFYLLLIIHQQLTYLGVIWRVVLNNPIHFRYIETSSGYICTQQDGFFGVTELEESLRSFGLLLFTLQDTKSKDLIMNWVCHFRKPHKSIHSYNNLRQLHALRLLRWTGRRHFLVIGLWRLGQDLTG